MVPEICLVFELKLTINGVSSSGFLFKVSFRGCGWHGVEVEGIKEVVDCEGGKYAIGFVHRICPITTKVIFI